jgi:hypothetical protein
MAKKDSIKTTAHASNKNKISIVIHNVDKKKKRKIRNKKRNSKGVSSTNQVPSVIISNTNPHPYSYPYSAPVSTYDAPRYTEEQVRNARLQQFDNGLVQQALSPNNENKHDALVQEVISQTQEENPLLSQTNQSNTTNAPPNQSTTDSPSYFQIVPGSEIETPVDEAIYRTPKKRKMDDDNQESNDVVEIGIISKGPNKGDLKLSGLNKAQLISKAIDYGIITDRLTIQQLKKEINKAHHKKEMNKVHKSFKESKHTK